MKIYIAMSRKRIRIQWHIVTRDEYLRNTLDIDKTATVTTTTITKTTMRALAFHQNGLGSIPGADAIQCMWVEFVSWFQSLLQGFFAGFSGFPPSTKTNISKFQLDLETVDQQPLRGYASANSHLFIIYPYFILHPKQR